MKGLIAKIKANNYIVHIITLMSGTLIAQVITLAVIPVLTRLYTPVEFGLYSLFLSIIVIVGSISSLKYDQAIMLPKEDKDAQALVFLSFLITLGISFLSFLVIALFYDFFVDYFEGMKYAIWLIPFAVLLTGLIQIFTAYSSRKQYYKMLASTRVANSATLVSVQTLSRYFFKFDGLILGKILADIVTFFLLFGQHYKKQTLHLKSISKRRLQVNAKRHEHFPKYQSISSFLNAISQNLPILLLASFYSAEEAGFYALAIRVLQAPVGLIGGSTRQVYYQRASKLYSENKDIFSIFSKTTFSLLKIFIGPFIIVLFFGEPLFSFLFGAQWAESGTIAQILILWILFLFINSPSIATFSIIKLQKLQMKVEFISVAFRFLSIYAGYYFFNSYIASIAFFALSSIAVNIFMIGYIYMTLKQRNLNE